MLFKFVSWLKVYFERRLEGSLLDYIFKTSIGYLSRLYELKSTRILYAKVSGRMNAFDS